MRTVHKFGMVNGFAMEAVLDEAAKVVLVAIQNGRICVWIENDPAESISEPKQRRMYRIFGTGHDIPDGWNHVGSVVDGPHVWHVYENWDPL